MWRLENFLGVCRLKVPDIAEDDETETETERDREMILQKSCIL